MFLTCRDYARNLGTVLVFTADDTLPVSGGCAKHLTLQGNIWTNAFIVSLWESPGLESTDQSGQIRGQGPFMQLSMRDTGPAGYGVAEG